LIIKLLLFNALVFLCCGAVLFLWQMFVVANTAYLFQIGKKAFVCFYGVDKGFGFSINRNCRGRPANGVVGQQG
jgi:hypothetical protein